MVVGTGLAWGGGCRAICQFLAELGLEILPVHSLILSEFLDFSHFCFSLSAYPSHASNLYLPVK